MSEPRYSRTCPVNYHSAAISKEEYDELLEEHPHAGLDTTYSHTDGCYVSTVVFSRLTDSEEPEPADWEDGPCDTCGEQITWSGDLDGYIMFREGGPEWVCKPCRKAESVGEEGDDDE